MTNGEAGAGILIFAVDSPSTIVFAFFLCASAGVLVVWHIRAWRQARQTEMDARERDFCRRQFRRRMQTSAMLGVLGVAIGVGQRLLSGGISQSAAVLYWCGVVGLVLWLVLLAIADITATSFHYGREKNQYLADRARLQGEIQRVKAEVEGEKGGYPLAGEGEGERA
jgi:hypothetical protein